MQIRNTKRNVNGGLDTEINHTIYGWVPYTYDATETNEIAVLVGEQIALLDLATIPDYVEPVLNAADLDLIARMELKEIDLLSIRSIREYIVSQPDAPATLKTHNDLAQTKRANLL